MCCTEKNGQVFKAACLLLSAQNRKVPSSHFQGTWERERGGGASLSFSVGSTQRIGMMKPGSMQSGVSNEVSSWTLYPGSMQGGVFNEVEIEVVIRRTKRCSYT